MMFFSAHNLSHILRDLAVIYVGYETFYSPDFTLRAEVSKRHDKPDDFFKVFFA